MSVDRELIDRLEGTVADLPEDGVVVQGVHFDLPLSRALGVHRRHRGWQRRVVDGVMPNSPIADAPERLPFRILYALTEGIKASRPLEEVFTGEFAPLAPLYQVTTRGGKAVPVAFHVLAVKAAGKGKTDSKGYKEESVVLLCRRRDGSLDENLIERLLSRFRSPYGQLDLAQRTILQALWPDWTPGDSPHYSPPPTAAQRDVPYDPVACERFQQDMETLLTADVTPADFFHSLNLLLALHLGTYQPRLASRLNPEMRVLMDEFAQSDPQNLRIMRQLVEDGERDATHPFRGTLPMRAPPAGEMRSVRHIDPVRSAFDQLETELAHLHFSLLTLNRVRQLASTYLQQSWECGPEVTDPLVRTPLQILQRMQDNSEFASFLREATVLLAARFIHDQLGGQRHDRAWRILREAPSGLSALRSFYEMFDRDRARNKTATRAHSQGIAMTVSLLRQSDFGIIQTRRGLGSFFELGAGLLPLLILFTIGLDHDKLQVDTFWERLEGYGFRFSAGERDRLLGRLKEMGLYERFSDAGEANYVRNLLTIRSERRP